MIFKFLLAINILSILISYLRNMYFLIPLVLVITFLTGAFRDIGPDLYSYLNFFETIASGSLNIFDQSDIETSWKVLGLVMSQFLDTPEIMGFIFLLSISIRIWSLKIYFDNKAYRLLGFLIYVSADLFSRDLGQIRNGLGASLLCLAFALYQSQSRSRLLFLLPVISHLSYFSVYFTYVITRKLPIWLLFASAATCIIVVPIIFHDLIKLLYYSINQGVVFKLIAYASEGYKASWVLPMTFPLVLFSLCLSYIFMRRDKRFKIYFIFFLVSIMFFFSFLEHPVFSSRLYSLYTPILMFFVPDAIRAAKVSARTRSIIYFFTVVIFVLIVIYRYIMYFEIYAG
jgi:hypothetical protein